MALNIKDPATERSVRDLAKAAGEPITTAVRKAAEERLARLGRRDRYTRFRDDILEIAAHCASLPTLDDRSPEEIIGYDENGLPR